MTTRASRAALLFLLLFLLLALQLAPSAEAADGTPGVITLTGAGGSITAYPARHRAEVMVDGAGPSVFENARISYRANRITVTARTDERTLFAWANRTNGAGAIGLLVRGPDRRRKPQPFSASIDRIVLDGVRQLIRR